MIFAFQCFGHVSDLFRTFCYTMLHQLFQTEDKHRKTCKPCVQKAMQQSGKQAFKTAAKTTHCTPERHAAVWEASIQDAGPTIHCWPQLHASVRKL